VVFDTIARTRDAVMGARRMPFRWWPVATRGCRPRRASLSTSIRPQQRRYQRAGVHIQFPRKPFPQPHVELAQAVLFGTRHQLRWPPQSGLGGIADCRYCDRPGRGRPPTTAGETAGSSSRTSLRSRSCARIPCRRRWSTRFAVLSRPVSLSVTDRSPSVLYLRSMPVSSSSAATQLGNI
jgi:hypothetical protein